MDDIEKSWLNQQRTLLQRAGSPTDKTESLGDTAVSELNYSHSINYDGHILKTRKLSLHSTLTDAAITMSYRHHAFC